MNHILKFLFFGLFIKPVVFILLGLNIRGRNNLPKRGPAIIVANHNSHLDTMVLMSLFRLSRIKKVRPVAAADYFVEQGGFRAWLSEKCIGIIPMDRSGTTEKEHLFDGCNKALDNDEILIIFPEGSRGEPEQMSQIKKGVYHLLKDRDDAPLVPVMLHGLGRALPKGEALLVPYNCDVVIGQAVEKLDSADEFVSKLESTFDELSTYCLTLDQTRDQG